jgi:hypothetical protein
MLAVCLRCLIPNSYTLTVALLALAVVFLTSKLGRG